MNSLMNPVIAFIVVVVVVIVVVSTHVSCIEALSVGCS